MKKPEFENQEAIDKQLIEDISQIQYNALGEEAVVCQVCSTELREGTPVTAYAFRPAGEPVFEIGHVKCTDDRHGPTECFTLGMRELVVEGRVGWCSDQATQSSWPVLLAPQVYVVSQADRKSGEIVSKEQQDGGREQDLDPIPALERTNPKPTIIDTIEHCTKRGRDPGRQRPFRAAWGDTTDTDADDCTDQQGGEKR
jgi:hypothetical protein